MLQLFVHLAGRLLDSGRILGAAEGLCGRLFYSSRRGLQETCCSLGALCLVVIVLCRILLFDNVAEDVVKNKVTICLTGKNESLGELLVGLRLVRDLTNDLDDDVGVGGLGVDVGYTNFAISEVEVLDVLVDSLVIVSVHVTGYTWQDTYFLANAYCDLVGLIAENELRSLVVEKLDLSVTVLIAIRLLLPT